MQLNLVQNIAPPSMPMLGTSGERAHTAVLEFLTAYIRNRNTRIAYANAISDFMKWCDAYDIHSIQSVRAFHVAAWVEDLTRSYASATVKQQLAAIKSLYDWLVVKQVVPHNPAAPVRGPRQASGKGKTPVLTPEEARQLLESIEVHTVKGLRDRALIALMLYSFARVGAVLSMQVSDVFFQQKRMWVRLHEKGGKLHDMPCHHELEHWLGDYLEVAGMSAHAALFRSVSRAGHLTSVGLKQPNALAMVKSRAERAGLKTNICNHTFRATGITSYLSNKGTLEVAARMANHASTRTTQLYDRRSDEIVLAEVERIRF